MSLWEFLVLVGAAVLLAVLVAGAIVIAAGHGHDQMPGWVVVMMIGGFVTAVVGAVGDVLANRR